MIFSCSSTLLTCVDNSASICPSRSSNRCVTNLISSSALYDVHNSVVVAFLSDRFRWRGPFILICLPLAFIGETDSLISSRISLRYISRIHSCHHGQDQWHALYRCLFYGRWSVRFIFGPIIILSLSLFFIAILPHPVFCECATPNERHVIQIIFVPALSSPTTPVVIIRGQPLQLFSWRLPTQGTLCPVPETRQ